MLFRKVEKIINDYFKSETDKILLVRGARQIGKSFIIRHCANLNFEKVVEINLIRDYQGERLFEKVRTTDDFYMALAAYTSQPLGNASDTIIILDEIQQYPELLTLMKFLREENRYRYVASGSLLGVTLKRSASIPLGSVDILNMYPLDFEEFLIANDFGHQAIDGLRECFRNRRSVPQGIHERVMSIFRRYLLVGGLPEAVNKFLDTRDLIQVRSVHATIKELYMLDASKYDAEHSLKIARIYSLIPSNMENKKKRVIYKEIENKHGKRATDYEEEMEFLINSGVALGINAISNPRFPLAETEHKNLIKLYLNDPGLLTFALYGTNPSPILNDDTGINIGSVYECAVACQLASNNNKLFYYDNRTRGEVDFLYDDFDSLSVIPIEVKSGKDYKRHVAVSRFVNNEEYGIREGFVLSNNGEVEHNGRICYVPIYFSLFFDNRMERNGPVII